MPFIRLNWLLISFLWCATAQARSASDAERESGDAWTEIGNPQRALEHYRRSVALDQKNLDARLALANALYLTGQREEALRQLARLEKLAPELAAVPSAVGVIQLELGKPVSACEHFERALRLDPRHERSLFGLGQCHLAALRRGDDGQEKDLARKALERYLASFPKGSHAIAARQALQDLRYGQAAKMLEDAREALAKGKFRMAESLLRQVTVQQPDLPEAHYLLGMALASPVLDQVDKAREELRLAGNMKEALLQRAIFAFEDDELEEAADLLQQVLEQEPAFSSARYQLGLVYLEMGRREEAKDAFARVVAEAPGTPLAERASSKIQIMTGEVQALREGEVIDAPTEVALGRRITQAIEKQYGLVEDGPLQERLNAILRRVVEQSDFGPAALPYRVKILRVDGVNALSFIGGTIYLFKGLTDFVRQNLHDSDDAYAAILGHELVHIVLRHGLGMLNLVGGSRAWTTGSALDPRSLNQLMTGISRIHEYEADQLGCLYAYRAGFDPAAAFRFHRMLISKGKEIPEGLDHPTHAERSDQLREYLLGLRTKARHFDAGIKALDARDYQLALTHFEIVVGLFPGCLAARNNMGVAMHHLALASNPHASRFKLSTDIDPRAHLKPIRIRSAKQPGFDRAMMIEAAELFRGLARSHPNYRFALKNLGACELALGRTEEARRIFEQALKTAPDDPECLVNLAVADLMGPDAGRGISRLQQVLERHPRHADAYFNLGMGLLQDGRKDEARSALLKYLQEDPSSGWAELAREHLAKIK